MGAPIYTFDEIMEFKQLEERTEESGEELEEAVKLIQEKFKLNGKETLYTLARVVDTFLRLQEEDNYFKDESLDAEAAFNDYFLKNRDINEDAYTLLEHLTNKPGN